MLWLAKNTIKKCIQQILVKLLFKVTHNNFVRKERLYFGTIFGYLKTSLKIDL
jgi:hypothetical protein